MQYKLILSSCVPGSIWEKSQTETGADGLRKIKEYQFNFQTTSFDDFFTSNPDYFVTSNLCRKLATFPCSGVKFIETPFSIEPELSGRASSMPSIFRLDISGEPGKDDICRYTKTSLIISERVYNLLKTCQIEELEVCDFTSENACDPRKMYGDFEDDDGDLLDQLTQKLRSSWEQAQTAITRNV